MKKSATTKSITQLLQNSLLANIVQRANELNTLNDKIQQRLPVQYRGLYRIANLYDNLLIIDVQNGTVRQGLLWQEQTLISLIQQDFPTITALQFNINPNFNPISI